MKMFFLLFATMLSPVTVSSGESPSPYPPWEGERNPSAEKGTIFETGDIDNMPDFHGNPMAAEFVIFAGGNYFFALDELVAAFEKAHPELRGRIFYETIPPGVIARQMEDGNTITVGNFTLSIQPDIVQAGKNQIKEMAAKGMVEGPGVDFISNRLAIMVRKGNPRGISSLADLGKLGVRLANPNPETEGIAKKIQEALRKAGGDGLVTEVYEKKVKRGDAFITQIHHRQTPLWIMQGKADAGVVWLSEARFQERIGHPIESVSIVDAENEEGVETAATVRGARNPRMAKEWLGFVRTKSARSILEKYGMGSPG